MPCNCRTSDCFASAIPLRMAGSRTLSTSSGRPGNCDLSLSMIRGSGSSGSFVDGRADARHPGGIVAGRGIVHHFPDQAIDSLPLHSDPHSPGDHRCGGSGIALITAVLEQRRPQYQERGERIGHIFPVHEPPSMRITEPVAVRLPRRDDPPRAIADHSANWTIGTGHYEAERRDPLRAKVAHCQVPRHAVLSDDFDLKRWGLAQRPGTGRNRRLCADDLQGQGFEAKPLHFGKRDGLVQSAGVGTHRLGPGVM